MKHAYGYFGGIKYVIGMVLVFMVAFSWTFNEVAMYNSPAIVVSDSGAILSWGLLVAILLAWAVGFMLAIVTFGAVGIVRKDREQPMTVSQAKHILEKLMTNTEIGSSKQLSDRHAVWFSLLLVDPSKSQYGYACKLVKKFKTARFTDSESIELMLWLVAKKVKAEEKRISDTVVAVRRLLDSGELIVEV